MEAARAKIQTPIREGDADSVDEEVERAAGQMLDALGPMDSGMWDAVIADLPTPESR